MASKGAGQAMFAVGLTILIAGSSAFASNLIISHAPDYLKFRKDAGAISTSDISGLISSAFGHSLDRELKWKGMEQGSFFHRPKANVLFTLEDVQDMDLPHVAKYPAIPDDPVVDTVTVANYMQGRPTGDKAFIVDFSEDNVFEVRSRRPALLHQLPATLGEIRSLVTDDDHSAFSHLAVGTLNVSRDEDATLMGSMQVIHMTLRALQAHSQLVKDDIPDLFHFRIGGLSALREKYGPGSQQVVDANSLLRDFLKKVTAEFAELYKTHVLVEILTVPKAEAKVRKARSLLQEKPPSAPSAPFRQQLNLADEYDANFAAIFNITLWTLIFLGLVVASVSYGLWSMDPGRDSIIYRMTSQRIKKD